jgi:hypothetical protein
MRLVEDSTSAETLPPADRSAVKTVRIRILDVKRWTHSTDMKP